MKPFLLVVLAALVGAAQAEPVRPLSAAILDFKESSEVLAGTGASISTLLQVNLGEDSESPLVERTELHEILNEQELTLSGIVTTDQAAKLGQVTGAEVLISGRVFAVQNRVHVVAKVISASTGRVFGVTADFERQGAMGPAVSSLSKQIAANLTEKRADLVAAKPLEESQLELLKSIMKDRKAPKVFVSIKETVIAAQPPDPAAQTELLRTLQAAGWTMVEAEKEADVVVTGEAFAETGIRRGNLWFVKARLEFTVKNAAGKVLKTDRVVAGTVDLAQAIGAKSSLQKTGLLATIEVAGIWAAAEPIR